VDVLFTPTCIVLVLTAHAFTHYENNTAITETNIVRKIKTTIHKQLDCGILTKLNRIYFQSRNLLDSFIPVVYIH